MKTPDLEISLSIPEVALRHSRNQKSHFVYRVSVTITPLTEEGVLQAGEPAVEWVVGHRYSIFSELHNDLMGQSAETVAGVKRGTKPKSAYYAHGCLPRPLPGLDQLSFPQKRFIPTVPELVVCHFPLCGNPVYDEENNADILVSKPSSSRLNTRRLTLETYLRDLIDLVWKTVTLGSVANVFSAMNDDTGQRLMNAQCKICIANKQIRMDCHLCAAFHKLITLLPILAPNDFCGA